MALPHSNELTMITNTKIGTFATFIYYSGLHLRDNVNTVLSKELNRGFRDHPYDSWNELIY